MANIEQRTKIELFLDSISARDSFPINMTETRALLERFERFLAASPAVSLPLGVCTQCGEFPAHEGNREPHERMEKCWNWHLVRATETGKAKGR
jgi:hypothetical protein